MTPVGITAPVASCSVAASGKGESNPIIGRRLLVFTGSSPNEHVVVEYGR